jgi:hypothetical protein
VVNQNKSNFYGWWIAYCAIARSKGNLSQSPGGLAGAYAFKYTGYFWGLLVLLTQESLLFNN